MNVKNKFARIMRNTGPARFFIPLGIILIVFEVFMIGFCTDGYVKTTGKITEVTALPKEADEHNINVPYGKYFYRFWTPSNDFDLLFLTIFAISETEQSVIE